MSWYTTARCKGGSPLLPGGTKFGHAWPVSNVCTTFEQTVSTPPRTGLSNALCNWGLAHFVDFPLRQKKIRPVKDLKLLDDLALAWLP